VFGLQGCLTVPIYEYEPESEKCDICRGRFEFFQKMSDKPLTVCPVCGQPCHRVISRPAGVVKDRLSTSNMADLGFTKYVKTSDGTYEKEGGPGPELLDSKKKKKRT
jgi:putative FmdB family regulatory protein